MGLQGWQAAMCVWRISSPEEQSGAALSDSHLLCVLGELLLGLLCLVF
jgi:hypothetical protein